MRTVGVEEELLLVDEEGRPAPVAATLLAAAADAAQDGPEGDGTIESPDDDTAHGEGLEAELQQQQVEIDSVPCQRLDDLGADLARRRQQVGDLARAAGVRVVALGTSPLPVVPLTTPKTRYRRIAEHYGLMEEEQLTCACHVHVSVASEEEGVAVLDRIRVWLPVLVAMSANSPFWQGRDTRYAGYRTQVWARWPAAGPVDVHGSPEGYQALVDGLLDTGAVLDRGMVYFDARLSAKYPTVEVRVPDVAQDVRHSVLVAGLTRALVDTAVAEWRDGRPAPETPTAVLRAATWRASRFGLEGDLVHPVTDQQAPADRVVADLLDVLTPALVANGDLDLVGAAVDRVLADGTGAAQQRRAHARRGSLGDVVRAAVEVTQQSA
jgi:carboxylate-amine ligase